MGKSSYHRSENTYKFQSFSERIASVNVDVIHTIKHHDDTPEENSTYFGEALEKWLELNYTQHFDDFKKEITDQVKSFAQLVHHEAAIVASLKKHLQVPNSLAFEPLLDLVVQLARDLQMDFYKYFHNFFDLLVGLLDKYPQDTDLLEKLFCCLSYLFKFLWRYMVRDIKDVYRFFSTLLSGHFKEYIRNFAAESFAFLMRKVKDHGELFDYMFLTLEDNIDTVEGVGRLMFEMMKGVKKQFHSCTDKVFPVLLSKTGHCQQVKKVTELPWQLVEKSLSHTFLCIAQHTDREHSSIVWSIVLNSVSNIYQSWVRSTKKLKQKYIDHLQRLLKLTNSWFIYRHGYIVTTPDKIADTFIPLLKEENFTEEFGQTLLDSMSSLLLSCHTQLSIQHTAKTISQVFKTDYPTTMLYEFAKSLLDLPIFEKDVLPELLRYSHQLVMSGSSETLHQINLHMFTEILIKKAPVPHDGSDLEEYKIYPLDFGSKAGLGFQTNILSNISHENMVVTTDSGRFKVWCSLICLPHVRPAVDEGKLDKLLKRFFKEFMSQFTSSSSDKEIDELLFILHQFILTVSLVQNDKDVNRVVIPYDTIKDILLSHYTNIHALRAADLYFTQATLDGSSEILKEENLLEVFPVLQENLSSCHSEVRLLTLRILSQFHVNMPAVDDIDYQQTSVFRICLDAENVPLTVQDYRQKLMYLQKLEFDIVQNNIPVGPFSQVAFRYLIGSLFINFKLLWEPIRELIASHARGLDKQVFWNIYLTHLQNAADKAEAALQRSTGNSHDNVLKETDNNLLDIFYQQLRNCKAQDAHPDYGKFRIHLWKAMHLFPEKCEPRSRDLCPLLFKFLENEYYQTDLNAAPKQNIYKQVKEVKGVQEKEEEGVYEEEEDSEEELVEARITRAMSKQESSHVGKSKDEISEENSEKTEKPTKLKHKDDEEIETEMMEKNDESNDIDIENTKSHNETTDNKKQGSKKQRRAATSDLVVHLELFSKFKNPKSLFMEPKLKCLYEELLLHKDHGLQKVAFKCIMTYKHPYLTPYRENFERLLDDKKFKNEIVLFSIDNENSAIAMEHRNDLLPVLMRILYGKINQRTGSDNAGKSYAHVRRSIVFRFLNGCTRQEVCMFMDMVFAPLKHLISDNSVEKIREVQTTLNLAEVFPLRRMSGALNTMDMIMKKLGHLLEDYLPNLFKINIGLLAICVGCLERRGEITPAAVNTLKNLRNLAISRLIQFFENFDSYEFSASDIDAIFEVAVWPQVQKLSFEGIYHPTVLLKLLHTWTKQKRSYVLLSKYQEGNREINPLAYVFQLLNAKDVDLSVTNLIMDMVENLLTSASDIEDNTGPAIPVNNILTLKPTNIDNAETIGISLLMPHIPAILQHLHKFVTSLKSHLNRKQGKCKELNILSRISGFVTDKKQCSTLILLLLPFLQKGVPRSQEAEQNILNSIYNLMKMVEERLLFYRPVCHLFSTLEPRQSRNLLCNILQAVTEQSERFEDVFPLVSELNSWDPKRMDEPDYMVRLNAYKKINDRVKSMEDLDVEFLLPIIYNSCFFIRMINDMSIRDNSTHCLVTLIKQFEVVSYDQDIYREIIAQGLLPEVKAGFRNKNETVRHEFITLLSSLAEVFSTHVMFSDLVGLKDKDPEADFFENMKHIQIHRRARALRKLGKYLNTETVRQEILLSYFLPLTSSFINDETYSKHNDLQDAAIETLGRLCRLLPWNQYLHQLKHYLNLLPKRIQNQKIIIRVIVSVLDGFHFDLSNSDYKITNAPVFNKQNSNNNDKEKDTSKAVDLDEKKVSGGENEDIEQDDTVEIDETEQTTDEAVAMETDDIDDDTSANDKELTKDGSVKCQTSLATRIHKIILRSILPQLHKTLTQKAKSESEHKLAKTKYAEDTEILRVPVALAMIKLIQKLPQGSLKYSLPGILIKVCNFLKSRARDIRETARGTLVKILMSLGPSYFPYILTELRGTLQRGYQLHVLSFTVHTLLRNMAAIVQPGDLDVCQRKLQEVFNEELFGKVAEEKEVDGITNKVFEAKTVKSYDSYQILAQFIGKGSLVALITPIKQVLDSTHSHKVARKVQEVMKKITQGLLNNANIDVETLMVFTHGLISETLPVISESKKEKKSTDEKDEKRKPESCLILPATPQRGGDKPKPSKKTNLHILVEFGLQVLNMALKKSRLNQNDKNHLMMLDPFIEGLAECLFSKHVKINTVSLRCLCWLLKFPLPSLKKHMNKLANGMFILLRNYASAGAAKGDNLHLVTTAFKAVTVLVRDVQCHSLDSNQLQVLLTFCEEDLHDFRRQSTAFTLLKAILSRKLNVTEIHELMNKVENLSINADSPHVRRECRQVTLQYLTDYPLGKKLIKHLEFFVTQLSYEMEMGRESALEMLATIFSTFPQTVLMKHAGFFFIPMSAALVNDESAKCRKLTALAIKSLLEKIDHNSRNNLFSIVVKWFADKKLRHQTLAAQLCGLFVEVESAKFEHHLKDVLPLIEQQLEPGKYEKAKDQTYEQDADHLLYNTLNTLRKILQECNIIHTAKWTDHMNVIWDHVENHLLHPHIWVRLACAQLYGLLFMAWKPEDVITENSADQRQYLQIGSYKKIESLAVVFCTQLQSQYLNEDLSGQVVKNMVFITKVAMCFHTSVETIGDEKDDSVIDEKDKEDDDLREEQDGGNEGQNSGKNWRRLSLPWLVRKMTREANHEAVSNTKSTIKRSSVFKWMAAISLDLGVEILPSVLPIMLPSLQREIADQTNTQDPDLKALAQEVVEMLKRIVGVEIFTGIYSEVQRSRDMKKGVRKRQRALEAVSNPDIAARRKIKKHVAKQEAKKRKIESFRNSKKVKKQRLHNIAVME